jgi:hypothetical protein
MIELPDFEKAFTYENQFYLSCQPIRIAKLLAHYELYRRVESIPGKIIECGVFKGTSLLRFAIFRELFSNSFSKQIIGFDTFGKFPETSFEQDQRKRQKFIDNAGEESISKEQLLKVLEQKGILNNIDLVEGDILETIPNYLKQNPETKISLLNLDTDVYEPAVKILEELYPRINSGGILILDDYGVFPGETKAVDEYFDGRKVTIQKFPFCMTPCYVVKP